MRKSGGDGRQLLAAWRLLLVRLLCTSPSARVDIVLFGVFCNRNNPAAHGASGIYSSVGTVTSPDAQAISVEGIEADCMGSRARCR